MLLLLLVVLVEVVVVKKSFILEKHKPEVECCCERFEVSLQVRGVQTPADTRRLTCEEQVADRGALR